MSLTRRYKVKSDLYAVRHIAHLMGTARWYEDRLALSGQLFPLKLDIRRYNNALNPLEALFGPTLLDISQFTGYWYIRCPTTPCLSHNSLRIPASR